MLLLDDDISKRSNANLKALSVSSTSSGGT